MSSTVETAARIKKALQKRSGKTWSVTHGKGTAYGWIHIRVPASRCDGYTAREEDKAELARLLSESHPTDSVGVPASSNYYQEYIDRAEGRAPTVRGHQYWD